MDNLFKALPRDLQWEILTEFVGTHVVRNGKLMRKMTGDIQRELLETTLKQGEIGRLILKNTPMNRALGRWIAYDGICFNTNVLVLVSKHNMHVFLCTKPDEYSNQAITSYRYVFSRRSYIAVLDDSVVLPPYIKHSYLSYPYTDKKKGIAPKKTNFHNPQRYYIYNHPAIYD